ncbi:MAG: hypothetical protein HPY60_11350 [Candidatus Methanofastidiosum sp.]|nr:hypothetical protein [Methanofastidiosum sp.]
MEKILFLISEESKNFNLSLDKIEELLHNGCNVTVISLSALTSIELKKRKIEYKTPSYYSDDFNHCELDRISLEFAQNWYKPFEEDITYRGINLGEMLEYDFYFLFVDVLRGFRIVERILSSECPNIIYIPNDLSLNDPNFVCYETLPMILQKFPYQKPVKIISLNEISSNIQNKSIQKYFSFEFRDKLLYFYMRSVNFYLTHVLYYFKPQIVFFWNVYAYRNISQNLKLKGYHPARVFPLKIYNKYTEKKINEINNICIRLKHTNFSEVKLDYNGYNISFFLEDYFEKVFKKFGDLIQYIEWAKQITHKFSQCMIVAMEDITPINRAVIRFFKINDMNSLVIQHGLVSKDMAGFGAMPIEATVQAVWGENSLKWHYKRGNKSQVITGNPGFDPILTYKTKFNREKVFRNLGLDLTKKIILITTERFAGITSDYTTDDEEEIIRSTLKSLKNFDEVQKIVKLHPGHQEKYARIIRNIAIEEDIDLMIFSDFLWDLILVCDVLITFASTTGLEAMLFGKAVVAVGDKEEVDSYVKDIAAVGVSDYNELAPTIKSIISGKLKEESLHSIDHLIYQNCFLNDGKSSERVANLIISLINNQD